MSETQNQWPPYNIGSADHLHAVGTVIAAWNLIERDYQAFIQLVFPSHMKAGIRTFDLLNNDGRIALIRDELPAFLNEKERDLLDHFLKAAYICKENRNVLAHSGYGISSDAERIILSKGRSKNAQSGSQMTLSVKAIREMADATFWTANFGLGLWSAVQVRISNESWAAQGVVPRFSQPLPEKPPLPRKWDQIRDADRAPAPPQPPASPA